MATGYQNNSAHDPTNLRERPTRVGRQWVFPPNPSFQESHSYKKHNLQSRLVSIPLSESVRIERSVSFTEVYIWTKCMAEGSQNIMKEIRKWSLDNDQWDVFRAQFLLTREHILMGSKTRKPSYQIIRICSALYASRGRHFCWESTADRLELRTGDGTPGPTFRLFRKNNLKTIWFSSIVIPLVCDFRRAKHW